MSIAIITAPNGLVDQPAGLPREVVSQLVERAAQAGRTVAVRACSSATEVVDCLRQLNGNGTEFVLFDPGAHSLSRSAIGACVSRLGKPSIEVHAGPCPAVEISSVADSISVIDGYGAQGYVLGLSIALEYLGDAECENRIHVGT
ncbi:type II 3-dehydroquinate dehydratase [Lysobacter sp. LF1]|uniref:3-dehydroquinate dehydratase n=1 Tax=Lysobacter stagni TaxID=3045172 RepID=A0ABT6XE44_9GAMM|nr:type II 3-dehydroquinate dehydratase [Lysobacter sp. LF1]MDI9238402.1 type II 3-dehydroquinate dehydratase [Lysobacter sp. LF1]